MTKVYFEVRREEPRYHTGEYEKLYIRLWPESVCNHYDTDGVPEISTPSGQWLQFEWQATSQDIGTDQGEWYGFHTKIQADSIHTINEFSKLARRVFRGLSEWEISPADLIGKLGRIKAEQITYDRRLSNHVTLSNAPAPYVRAWRDDYRTMGSANGCKVGCLAESENHAQREIGKKLADNPHYDDYTARWLEQGRPVMQLDGETPNTTPAEILINLDKPQTDLIEEWQATGRTPDAFQIAWDELIESAA